jgi:hypothetical protein
MLSREVSPEERKRKSRMKKGIYRRARRVTVWEEMLRFQPAA